MWNAFICVQNIAKCPEKLTSANKDAINSVETNFKKEAMDDAMPNRLMAKIVKATPLEASFTLELDDLLAGHMQSHVNNHFAVFSGSIFIDDILNVLLSIEKKLQSVLVGHF